MASKPFPKITVSILTLLAWFLVFVAGCSIESQPARCEVIALQRYTQDEIGKITNDSEKYKEFSKCSQSIEIIKENYRKYQNNKWELLWIFFLVIFGWGITNIAMISCASAMLGALMSDNYIRNGLIDGFIIYLVYISGLVIINGETLNFFENFKVLDYVKTSGSISLISFFFGSRVNLMKLKMINNIISDIFPMDSDDNQPPEKKSPRSE